MDRGKLATGWARYYDGWARDTILDDIEGKLGHLVGRMRRLQLFPQTMYKGFIKRELLSACGMSIGVLQQLRGRLTSVPRGVNLKGGGGA